MALMTLGMFVFETDTLPFVTMGRQQDWRFAQTDRFGARKATQFIGVGDDKITLSGALYGGQIGDYGSLTQIREMADTGDAYVLLDGLGNVMGNWFIRSLKDDSSLFYIDGVPRKKDFSLDLERAEDDAPQAAQSEDTPAETDQANG